MNFPAFFTSLVLGIMLIFLEIDWLGYAFIGLAIVFWVYDLAKKYSKEMWEDLKKTDQVTPEAKFEAYAKGASKQAAERIVKTKDTEYNYRKGAVLPKTANMAKNFFAELKELFK